MNDPTPSKVDRLSELPREVPPPHDGWPALEARLRAGGMPESESAVQRRGTTTESAWRRRPRMMQVAILAAVLASAAVGISIDRWILSPARQAPPVAAVPGNTGTSAGMTVAYVTDPRYLHEREALLRSLDAKLATLPPPTRKKVLQSLATIHQSMQEIQQALGREPGNALLQELLIDTYQDEMQVLSTVQQASGGGGET